MNYQKEYMESLKKLEEQWSKEQQKHGITKIELKDNGLIKTSREEVSIVSFIQLLCFMIWH